MSSPVKSKPKNLYPTYPHIKFKWESITTLAGPVVDGVTAKRYIVSGKGSSFIAS